MTDSPSIAVRFFRLSEALQPYFTALYLTVIDAGDELVIDYLHPEWAAMRFTEGPPPVACLGPGEMLPQWPFVAGGPTSVGTRFGVTTSRVWGLGLQPSGWAKFANAEAASLANRTVDGTVGPAFAVFAPILPKILACKDDDETRAQLINDHLMAFANWPVPREADIVTLQDALRDPAVGEVSDLQERLGMSAKMLERFCRRYSDSRPRSCSAASGLCAASPSSCSIRR